MKQLTKIADLMELAEDVIDNEDEELELLAQMLYDMDSERAMTLMRYIATMDMENRLEQRGLVV